MRAEVAAATADYQALNRPAAAATRFTGPLIDAEAGQEIARAAFGVHVVTDACASQNHGAVKNSLYGLMQAASGGQRKTSRRRQRMNPRRKESLVGIDVANSRKELLVQQPTLDGPAPSLQGCQELFLGDLPRVGAEPTKNLLKFAANAAPQPSKATDIAEAQLFLPFSEHQSHVGVKLDRSFARDDCELPRHA